jgi:inosine/xanthosine triphosphate pyrophosphatase family protein
MGEIPLDEKLAFNHRGHAFRALAAKIGALNPHPEDGTA